MAIASEKMVFYYMARDNLCFLTLCEDAYPKRLAFLYLEEIADIILNELQREYGTNVRCSEPSLLQFRVVWCDLVLEIGYHRSKFSDFVFVQK
jgi:Regulated-SNARE-like domain